ncbi:ABC transporter permease, partial [Streptomyces sp. SID7982]|nr:ABC transporter permease [Streptomyces sp. SID7982]
MTTRERHPATTDVRGPGFGPDSGPDRGLAYWAVVDCWNITRRTLTHYQRQPAAIVWQLG